MYHTIHTIVQSRRVCTFFRSAIVTALERHLKGDQTLEDVFRAIKSSGTGATPAIGRARVQQCSKL